MAIMDALARFIKDTDVDALVANTRSAVGDTYDTQVGYDVYRAPGLAKGRQGRDIGDGTPLYLNFIANDNFTVSSTATIKFDISSDDAVGNTGNLTVPAELAAYTFTGGIDEGQQFSVVVPAGTKAQRYLQAGVTCSEARSDAQTGSISIWFSTQPAETGTLYKEGRSWV